jgi:DNA-binding Lrp family transcriptional regulator
VIKAFTVIVDQIAYGKNMTAILSIKCEVGKASDIAQQLKMIEEIAEVYTTVGDYDIVAKIRTNDTYTLRRLVEKEITKIRGINEIRTSIVFRCVKENVNLVMRST